MRNIFLFLLIGLCLISFVNANLQDKIKDYWLGEGLSEEEVVSIIEGNTTIELEEKLIRIENPVMNISNGTISTEGKFTDQELWGVLFGGIFLLMVFGAVIFVLYLFVRKGGST